MLIKIDFYFIKTRKTIMIVESKLIDFKILLWWFHYARANCFFHIFIYDKTKINGKLWRILLCIQLYLKKFKTFESFFENIFTFSDLPDKNLSKNTEKSLTLLKLPYVCISCNRLPCCFHCQLTSAFCRSICSFFVWHIEFLCVYNVHNIWSLDYFFLLFDKNWKPQAVVLSKKPLDTYIHIH